MASTTAESAQEQGEIAAPAKRNRRWPLAVAVVGAAGLAAGGWYLTSMHSPMPIGAVAVAGASSDLEPQVLAAVPVTPGDAFSDVDAGRIAAAVEAIEGIESAQVDWQWWNTLVVRVVEQAPVAVVATPSGLQVLDELGQPIRQVAQRPAGLLLIEAGDDDSLTAALRLAPTVPPAWVEQAEALVVAGPSDVRLRLTDGAVVVLGTPTDVAEKLAIAEKLRATGAMTINVAVPERPALAQLPEAPATQP